MIKGIRLQSFVFPTFIVSLVAVGCSRSASSPPAPLDSVKLPATVNRAFTASSVQTRQLAAAYVSDFQGQDVVTAFATLQKLRDQQNLNAQQQTVIARAWMTTMQQLQAAAQNGNQAAQAAMHQYLSTR